MELIRCDESYRVGVAEIDQQHQLLFQLLNNFIVHFSEANTRDELRSVLEEMINYMDYLSPVRRTISKVILILSKIPCNCRKILWRRALKSPRMC